MYNSKWFLVLSLATWMTLSSARCYIHKDDPDSVTCNLATPRDYIDLSYVGNGTKSLTCVIEGTFNETAFALSEQKKAQLETLTISGPKNISLTWAFWTGAVSTIARNDTFVGFTGLRHLSINIALNYINPSSLVQLKNLESLDLSEVQIPDLRITAELLRSINNARLPIRILRLRHIQGFKQGRSPSETFAIKLRETIYKNVDKLAHLRELDLRDNNVIAFEPGLTEYLPNLEILRLGIKTWMYFSACNVGTCRDCAAFDLLFHPSLKTFEYSLPDQAPPGLHEYTATHILGSNTDPVFEACREDIFRALVSHTLSPLFNSTGQLCEAVNCFCNDSTHIPCDIIENRIDYAKLYAPECSLYVNIPFSSSLERLVFQNGLLLPVKSDVNICVRSPNSLTALELSQCTVGLLLNHHNITVKGLPNLKILNIEKNGIIFNGDIHLTTDSRAISELYLGYNQFDISFDQLPLVKGNPHLSVLDLQYSAIKNVPRTLSSALKNLRTLNMAGNHLGSLDVDLRTFLKLEFLNLSNNNLNSVSLSVMNQLDDWVSNGRRVELDLSLNPLECLCGNLDFARWLTTTTVLVAKHLTTCSHPTKGIILIRDVNYKALSWHCMNVGAIFTGVFSGLAVMAFAGIVVAVHKKRWTIRYLIHILSSFLRHGKPKSSGVTYKYDAFIAYTTHGSERSWVHTTLRTKLEDEFGLRLCIHYRDFPLARDIDESILDGINNSNKTVLILSPTFLQSGWCDFEFRMAKERQVKERRDCLVFVIYENINRTGIKLPRSLARMLDKKIYAEWTDDPDGQELFWGRLVKAIRDASGDDGASTYRDTQESAHLVNNII